MKDRICEALRFAIDHYDNAGIGLDGDYFFPPTEMLSLLNNMGMGEKNQDLLIVGILYNIVEDTSVTIDMIWENFGGKVAHYVGEHLVYLHLDLENGEPGKTEKLKKAIAGIPKLKEADKEIRILTLCDIVIKQRRLKRELTVRGEDAWTKQEVSKEELCSYFSKIQDELYEFQFDEMTSRAYWDMVDTFKDLFVTFYYDCEYERMFQVSADGECYVIAKADLRPEPWEGELPERVVSVNRRYAERIEDNWGGEYDLKNRVAGTNFEEYYVAVKNHLRGFLKDTSEEDLDRLMISNLEFVRIRYNEDAKRLIDGETTVDLFLTEGPAITADVLERAVWKRP